MEKDVNWIVNISEVGFSVLNGKISNEKKNVELYRVAQVYYVND